MSFSIVDLIGFSFSKDFGGGHFKKSEIFSQTPCVQHGTPACDGHLWSDSVPYFSLNGRTDLIRQALEAFLRFAAGDSGRYSPTPRQSEAAT
jgi:hypothetical protein